MVYVELWNVKNARTTPTLARPILSYVTSKVKACFYKKECTPMVYVKLCIVKITYTQILEPYGMEFHMVVYLYTSGQRPPPQCLPL